MRPQALLVGILAAVASALMFMAATRVGFSALFFLLVAPMPIYLAALSWGTSAGIVAAIGTVAVITGVGGFEAGISLGLMFAGPAAVLGHQVNLAQPDPDDPSTLQWYPLSRMLFSLAAMGAAAIIGFGMLIGFDMEQMRDQTVELMKELTGGGGGQQLSDEELAAVVGINLQLMPFVMPGFWLMLHAACCYLSSLIARRAGRLPRPRDDIARQASLPQLSLVILALALAGALLFDGSLGLACQVVAGSFFAAFALVGLAAMHERTRGWASRGLVLFAAYFLIILIYLPLFLFALFGLARVMAGRANT